MRCPDCNKFVGVDSEVEPEVDMEIDEEGHISGTVRIVNGCAECGSELAEASFEVDAECEDAAAHLEGVSEEDRDKHTFDIEPEVMRTDRFGKGRRAAHFYGIEWSATVKCSCGNAEFHVEGTDEVQASSMDSMT